jgi:hypothetical protein
MGSKNTRQRVQAAYEIVLITLFAGEKLLLFGMPV